MKGPRSVNRQTRWRTPSEAHQARDALHGGALDVAPSFVLVTTTAGCFGVPHPIM